MPGRSEDRCARGPGRGQQGRLFLPVHGQVLGRGEGGVEGAPPGIVGIGDPVLRGTCNKVCLASILFIHCT